MYFVAFTSRNSAKAVSDINTAASSSVLSVRKLRQRQYLTRVETVAAIAMHIGQNQAACRKAMVAHRRTGRAPKPDANVATSAMVSISAPIIMARASDHSANAARVEA